VLRRPLDVERERINFEPLPTDDPKLAHTDVRAHGVAIGEPQI
jgi:hypothetical protein